MYFILFLYFLLCTCNHALNNFDFNDRDILLDGKTHYQTLQERGKMPQYGECWTSAINNLHENCKLLSEESQAKIALKFTNCFLEMSGHQTHNCDTDIKPNLRRICLNSLDDRAFSVYREFFPHAQNMCFFLRNQIWHEETEKTIDRLSTSSAHVSEKLTEAEEKTEMILEQQKQSAKLFAKSKMDIEEMMAEFRTSTLEQKQVLFDLFENLQALQSWMIGEISWLDTVIFYVCSILVITLLTSSNRTANARVSCFIILSLHACVERSICTMIINSSYYDTIGNLNDLLLNSVWWMRRVTIGLMSIIYLYYSYIYCDYNRINHEILVSLKEQNEIIKNRLDKLVNDSSKVDTSTKCESTSFMDKNFSYDINSLCNIEKIDNLRYRFPKQTPNDNKENINISEMYSNDILSVSNNSHNLNQNLNKKNEKKPFTVDHLLGIKQYNLRSNSNSRTNTPERTN